jgi:hypothetical protein
VRPSVLACWGGGGRPAGPAVIALQLGSPLSLRCPDILQLLRIR